MKEIKENIPDKQTKLLQLHNQELIDQTEFLLKANDRLKAEAIRMESQIASLKTTIEHKLTAISDKTDSLEKITLKLEQELMTLQTERDLLDTRNRWYRSAYENRSLIGIVSDRILRKKGN
jgi:phage shock protein A